MNETATREELQPRSRLTVLLVVAAIGALHLALPVSPPLIAFFIVCAGLLVAAALRNPRGEPLLRKALIDRDGDSQGSWGTAAAGFLVLLAALAFLEIRDPYYFTQDDNYSMGPVAIAACRGFFEGAFPTWNPFQFLGQPTSVQSMYALTYPFTYVVFGIAHALGRDELYIDLFVSLHIIGGYWATYWAARTLKVRPPLAVAASLSFVLCGAVLMTGRSYATMTPLYLWMPLLVVATERLRRGDAGLRWAIGTALAVGLFCHSGNGQMWLYGVMFFGIAIITYFVCGIRDRASTAWVAVAAVFSIALALVLVIPQMWFMTGVARSGGGGQGITHGLAAMLLPMPLVKAEHPVGWGMPDQMAAFYYAGTVLTVAALVGVLAFAAALINVRGIARIVRDNVWLVCAAIALWFAFGSEAALWPVMSRLPLFDKLTGPWKFLIFFHLFAALAGAQILDRLLSRRAVRGAAFVTAILVCWGVVQTRIAFYDYGDDPYPPLPRAMEDLLKRDPETSRGRVLPIAPERVDMSGYARSMSLDFPSWYGVQSIDGYDPFARSTPEYQAAMRHFDSDPLQAARTYGVRWMIVHRSTVVPLPIIGRHRNMLERLLPARAMTAEKLEPHAKEAYRDADLVVYEIPDVAPLAFASAQPRRALPVKLSQNGVIVDAGAPQRPTAVVVNFLLLNGIVARAGEAALPIRSDEFGRIVVDAPAGARTLELRYEPPWDVALMAAACTILVGAIGAMVASQLRPKETA